MRLPEEPHAEAPPAQVGGQEVARDRLGADRAGGEVGVEEPSVPAEGTGQTRNSVRARKESRRALISSASRFWSRAVLNASTVKEAIALPYIVARR